MKKHSKDEIRIIPFVYKGRDYDLVFNPKTQGKRYILKEYVNKELVNEYPLTGVTTALNSINKPFLMTWTVKEMANYLKANCELVGGKYQATKQDIEAGMNAYITKRTNSTDIGTEAHDYMEDYIALCIETNNRKPIEYIKVEKDIPEHIRHIVKRFIDGLVEHFSELLESEKPVCSVDYGYAGTYDLLAKDKEGKLVLVDFKTSNQIDKLYASQIEAYKRANKEIWGVECDYGVVIRSEKLTDEEVEEHNKSWMGKKYPKTNYEYVEYKNRDNWWVLFISALAIHRTGIIAFDDVKDIEEFIKNY